MVETFAADIQGIEPELPVTFIFNGRSYIGLQTATPNSREMADAGFIPKYDLELTVRTNQFVYPLIPPGVGEGILIGVTPHRVESATPDQAGVSTVYHLVQRN